MALGPPQLEPDLVWGIYVYNYENETLRLHALRFTEEEVTTNAVGRVYEGGWSATVLTTHRQGFDMEIELDVIEPIRVPGS